MMPEVILHSSFDSMSAVTGNAPFAPAAFQRPGLTHGGVGDLRQDLLLRGIPTDTCRGREDLVELLLGHQHMEEEQQNDGGGRHSNSFHRPTPSVRHPEVSRASEALTRGSAHRCSCCSHLRLGLLGCSLDQRPGHLYQDQGISDPTPGVRGNPEKSVHSEVCGAAEACSGETVCTVVLCALL